MNITKLSILTVISVAYLAPILFFLNKNKTAILPEFMHSTIFILGMPVIKQEVNYYKTILLRL